MSSQLYIGDNLVSAVTVVNSPVMYTSYNLSNAGVLSKGSTVMNFEQIKDVAAECLKGAFQGDATISGVIDLRNLEGISGGHGFDSAFKGCTNITGVNLNSLTSVSGSYGASNMFRDCTGLSSSIDMSSLTSVAGTYAFSYAFAGNRITSVDLSGLQYISASNSFEYSFYNCSYLISVDLSSLKGISGGSQYMFSGCSSLSSINLSKLESISGNTSYMFYRCTSLTSIDLSSLLTISGNSSYIFRGCTSITSADLSNLDTITGDARNLFTDCTNLTFCDLSCLREVNNIGSWYFAGVFEHCSNIPEMQFYSLRKVNGSRCMQSPFGYCYALKDVYFYALRENLIGNTAVFYELVHYIDGCTIHFPKNFDPANGGTKIPTMETYPNFGGTNTVISYDLPSTFILTGSDNVQYERNPKYDTATSLAWRVLDTVVKSTTYYTSTTNDPQTGDTIYSDSSCTTVVTTISSIS